MRAMAAVCGFLAACYPSNGFDSCVVSCAAGGPCPGSQSCGADGMCHSGTTECSARPADAATGDGRAPMPDAPANCVGRLVTYCFTGSETPTLALGGTYDDSMCSVTIPQPDGHPSVCAFVGEDIETVSNVRFTGTLPVALIARDQISIEKPIDLDSHAGDTAAGANDGACASPTSLADPTINTIGANGGTFGGVGGQGGAAGGELPPSPVAAVDPLPYLRGGCPGGIQTDAPDLAASSGGGILIAAGSAVTIDSVVSANGQGGVANGLATGGRGGASGGTVALDARRYAGGGSIFANGGGGGGGGEASGSGTAGSDGNIGGPAAAGMGANGDGDGGAGSYGTHDNGSPGAAATASPGGGGGGGAGFVVFYLHGSDAAVPSLLYSPNPRSVQE